MPNAERCAGATYKAWIKKYYAKRKNHMNALRRVRWAALPKKVRREIDIRNYEARKARQARQTEASINVERTKFIGRKLAKALYGDIRS